MSWNTESEQDSEGLMGWRVPVGTMLLTLCFVVLCMFVFGVRVTMEKHQVKLRSSQSTTHIRYMVAFATARWLYDSGGMLSELLSASRVRVPV